MTPISKSYMSARQGMVFSPCGIYVKDGVIGIGVGPSGTAYTVSKQGYIAQYRLADVPLPPLTLTRAYVGMLRRNGRMSGGVTEDTFRLVAVLALGVDGVCHAERYADAALRGDAHHARYLISLVSFAQELLRGESHSANYEHLAYRLDQYGVACITPGHDPRRVVPHLR